MTGLDTTVIVRFLVRDDEKQAQAVYRRFKQAETARETLFVPLLVVLETIWVLEGAYDKTRKDVVSAVQDLRRMPFLAFERDEALQKVLSEASAGNFDLADLLIAEVARACGCERGITFDKGAAKIPFYTLLK